MGVAVNDLSQWFKRLNGRYFGEQPVEIGKPGDPERTGKYHVTPAKRTQD
jgi:hypothetical protein